MTVICCKNCGSEFGLKTSHVLTESKMSTLSSAIKERGAVELDL